jgi:competence protein ComEC
MLDTSICDLRSQLREIVHQQFPKQGSLIMSLLLGETQFKGEDQTNTFKRLGILHLLVVSGFHVTLVAEVLAHLLRLLTLPLSALGIIQGRRALQLLGIQTTLLIITVWGYCMVVGFSAATQRSFFLFILSILTRGGFLQSTYAQRSWLSLSLQALIFPLEFASKGNVLSWAAYLIVSAPRVREGMLRQGFIVPMLSQLTISLTVFALFGEISWAGLLANFLLGPIFSALISHSLYLVFFGSLLSWHSPLPDLCIDNLLQVLSHLSTLTLIYPWLYLQSSPLPSWQTWILLQVTALYLFYLHKPQSLQA